MPLIEVTMSVELPEDLGKFQATEVKIREAMFRGGAALMSQVMDLYEARVMAQKHLRLKDRRTKGYETLIGKVQKDRIRAYDHRRRCYFYPLDEWMGVSRGKKVSPGLEAAMVETAVGRSYRQAASEIERWTGVQKAAMSHWGIVQGVAQRERALEAKSEDWYRSVLPAPPAGEDPCPILAIDPDGTYCHHQDKEAKDHDVKVATLYTAKLQEDKKGKRLRLINKQILFSQSEESLNDFFNRVTQRALEVYGAHRQTKVVIHGDGDTWIKGLKINYWDQALLRLDPWHLKKKIRIATGLKQLPPEWESAIYGNPDLLISQISLWKLKHSHPNSKEREKLEDLISYIKNNREGLLPSGVSAETKKKYFGMFKRGSGTIESNIGHAFNSRFKLPRMSWSTKGLDNLAFLREKHLNKHMKPKFKAPKPLNKHSFSQNLDSFLLLH